MITLLLLVALQTDQPYQRFSDAYATLDADRVIQLYTEDCADAAAGRPDRAGPRGHSRTL